MAESSSVRWDQLESAYGDSRVVGELLQLALNGENAWGDLIGHVLHQGTLYEATVAVAAQMVEALLTQRLSERSISLRNPSNGKKIVVTGRALAIPLLSAMAESAHEALGSEETRPRYAAVAALVLEAIRPGIPFFEAAIDDPSDEVKEASSALLEVLADNTAAAGIDSRYQQNLRAKLGMHLARLDPGR